MEVDTRRKTSVTFSAKISAEFNGQNSAKFNGRTDGQTDGRTHGRTDERAEFPPKFHQFFCRNSAKWRESATNSNGQLTQMGS